MPQKPRDRDYKKEYARDHASVSQRANRGKRNAARYRLMKEGKVKKGDGKEIHHKTALSNGGSNNSDNWQVVSRARNRRQARKNGKA
jgi:hypothetical protein